MKTHFTTRLALLFAGLLVLAGWTQMKTARYTLESESKLWVEGTSTIHDWKCEAEAITGTISADEANPLQTLTGTSVTVPVDQLECGNSTMNKKMSEALKADAQPTVRYELQNAEIAGSPAADGSYRLQTTGRLTIAGQTHPIQMEVEAQPLPNGKLRFTGSQPIVMSEFDIDPPTAMFGTIKTGDRVVVHFDVVAAAEAGI